MAKGRKTGGRKKGTPNKATAEVRALAQQHTVACIERLAGIAKGDNPTAAAAACREVLDRGHGRPSQHLDITQPPVALLDLFAALDAEDAARATGEDERLEAEPAPVRH